MSDAEAKAPWGAGVRVSQPRLSEIAFRWEGEGDESFPESAKFEFTLAFQRFDSFQLGVEFRATVVDVPDFHAEAAFRAVFVLDPESPEGKDPDMALQLIAVRMAPVTLYPFCREALVSTAQRAGLTRFTPPIANVGLLWSPDEIEIPPPPDPDGEAEA